MVPLIFGEPRPLIVGPPAPGTVDLRPAWSPDGQHVVFERLSGGVRRLYAVQADGIAVRELETGERPDSHATGRPAFHDSDDFVFVSDRDGREALYRWRAGTVTPVHRADVPCHGPAPLPDGGLLYFQQVSETEAHVHALDPEGRSTPLTPAKGVQDQPWSLPGGRAFVYHATVEGRQVVCRQALQQGAAPVVLGAADEGTPYVTPMPSPDGQWIAFVSAETGTPQVWVMDMDGQRRERVTSGPPHAFPAWAPDGRALVVVQGEPTRRAEPTGTLQLVPVSG